MFLTQYDKGWRRPCHSGSRYVDEFQLVTEPDGNTHLEKTGSKDLYQEIQSYKDGCLIDNIVRRAVNGDFSVLSRGSDVYGEATFDAYDLIAANDAVKQAQSIYKSLPAEKRAEYGSFDAFVKTFGSLDGIKKFMKPAEKKKSSEQKPEGGVTDVAGSAS